MSFFNGYNAIFLFVLGILPILIYFAIYLIRRENIHKEIIRKEQHKLQAKTLLTLLNEAEVALAYESTKQPTSLLHRNEINTLWLDLKETVYLYTGQRYVKRKEQIDFMLKMRTISDGLLRLSEGSEFGMFLLQFQNAIHYLKTARIDEPVRE